mgnify:CR=1 FL=1
MSRPNLRLRRDLGKIRKEGSIFRGQYCHVRFRIASEQQLVISVRKKYGGSVQRNLIRRQIRAICRELFGSLKTSEFLLLISVGDHSYRVSYQELKKELSIAFQFLGLT